MTTAIAPEFTDDLPLDAAIEEYLLACDIEGKSPRTVQSYRETLRIFRRICVAGDLPATVAAFRAGSVGMDAILT